MKFSEFQKPCSNSEKNETFLKLFFHSIRNSHSECLSFSIKEFFTKNIHEFIKKKTINWTSLYYIINIVSKLVSERWTLLRIKSMKPSCNPQSFYRHSYQIICCIVSAFKTCVLAARLTRRTKINIVMFNVTWIFATL